ncbi:LysR family transcriptional regulator [Pseudomonas sp. NPDC087342]|uniref:LysR family transcriptional regulator n=1 Tax=Pseudomonas sp. NPDC087342 TaxID=3364437 RepID=UPI00382297C3
MNSSIIGSNTVLDLNEIAMFIQVVHEGSFAGAARRMGIPANTLSRRIGQLEEQLSVRLLQRSTRKLALTDAGRSLYDLSAAQVNDLIDVGRYLVSENLAPSGAVRVAAPADFFDVYMMEWIADFLRQYPGIQLDFLLSDSRDDLIDKGIDVAFRGGELPDSNLIARKVGTEFQILAASPDYLQNYGSPQSVEELTSHQCIRHTRTVGNTKWVLDGPTGLHEVEVTGRFCANTAQSQLKAALAGLGICLLPLRFLNDHLQSGRLTHILPEIGRFNVEFYIVYPSRRQVPLAVACFVEKIVEHLQHKTTTSSR